MFGFALPGERKHIDKERLLIMGGLAAFGLLLSVVSAQLVVGDLWPIAMGMILALPAFILLHRYPMSGVMIWLLLTPFLVATNGGAARKAYWVIHRLLPPATLAILVLGALLRIHARKLPRLGGIELAMLGYLGITQISIIYLNDSTLATTYHLYDRVFVPMCLYLLVRLVAPSEADLRRLLPIFIFILLVQSMIGLLSWVAPQFLPSPWLNRAGLRTTGSLRAYSVFSTTIIFAGLYILHVGSVRKDSAIRIWPLLLFLLTGFMVFLSYSRGSWLAGLVVLAGVVGLYPAMIRRAGLLLAPALVVIVLVGALLLPSSVMGEHLNRAGTRFYSSQSEESALSRLPVYYASYRMFAAKPLFGWGYGNFDRFDRQFQERILDLVSPAKDHASHNLYLTLLAEQGLVGLLLFLVPPIAWLARTVRAWPHMPRDGVASRKLVAVLWLVLVSHVIVNNFSNMRVVFGLGMWWIALGLIAHLVTSARSSSDARVDSNLRYRTQITQR